MNQRLMQVIERNGIVKTKLFKDNISESFSNTETMLGKGRPAIFRKEKSR